MPSGNLGFPEVLPDYIYTIMSEAGDSPLVIDVSRSGTRYPPEFLLTGSFQALHTKVLPYVERMVLPCGEAGTTLIMAQFPPMFADPNRPADDIDPDMLDAPYPTPINPLPASVKKGTGLIHSQGADYSELYDRKLTVREVQRRIELYYTPYHEKLGRLLQAKHEKHGKAFQLSCHSMSAIGPADGLKRPEICLGDLDGTTSSPDYVALVTEQFEQAGFEVALNKPFRGNELLRRHSDPANGMFGLQVEVRRDLYIDQQSRLLHDGLLKLQQCYLAVSEQIKSLLK